MSDAIETLVEKFESHQLSRRELVASLAAIVASAGSSAAAQTPATTNLSTLVQGRSLNHASLAVTDVAKAAEFYGTLLDAKVVSRPGNGGINLGLGDGFLGLYRLNNPGTVNHICIGVDNFDADRLAATCKQMGIAATVDRNPNNRTSGGDQLYIQAFDNHRLQIGPHGYQG
ncbi:MAG: VOC family protein [Acidobacteriota bacterium]|nr:VOC family protein [Acidobacteriota bacterium]